MILDIITLIRDMVKMVNPLAVFECDQARMLNVKVDTMERFVTDSDGNRTSSDFVYVEEPTTGYYDIPYRGHQKQRTIMQIYFCKFEPMVNDAYKGDTKFSQNSPTIGRLELKNQIEEQMVRPFLYLLKTSELGLRHPEIFNTIRIMYPSPRFDANEVSVGLEITFNNDWCLDLYQNKIFKPLLEVVKPGYDLSGRTLFFDRQDLPLYSPSSAKEQTLFFMELTPLLTLYMKRAQTYVAAMVIEGGGPVNKYIYTEKQGWTTNMITYPDDMPGLGYVVSNTVIDPVPEGFWSLKHCYIK